MMVFRKENFIQQEQQCKFLFLSNFLINFTYRNDQTFHVIFASSMKRDYLVYPSMIGAQSGVIYSYYSFNEPMIFDDSNPLKVSAEQCDNLTVCLWYVSPIWQLNDTDSIPYALLGEFRTWAGVSKQRITSIVRDTEKNQVTITVQGLLNEHVTLVFSVLIRVLEYTSCFTSATNGQVRFIVTPHSIMCA